MKRRLLHFDDEPFIAGAVRESLHIIYGWDVRLVSEADELFSELQNNQYDAIIMDIMAPVPSLENKHVTFTQKEINEMDSGMKTGVVLTKKIWQMENYENVPVLFLTAKSMSSIVNEYNNFISQGKLCDFLRKPELVSTISVKLQELTQKNDI